MVSLTVTVTHSIRFKNANFSMFSYPNFLKTCILSIILDEIHNHKAKTNFELNEFLLLNFFLKKLYPTLLLLE
jgi:hypothetical protein